MRSATQVWTSDAPGRARHVIHVTEALGGGVLTGILDIARAQVRDGVEVSLIHTRRPDTPSADDLASTFDGVLRATEVRASVGHVRLAAAIGRAALADPSAAIHLHSSIAGAVGRVVATALGASRRTLYSPHGFAFLRLDVSAPSRTAARLIEKSLGSRCAGLMLVSNSEYVLAAHTLPRARLFCVENAQPAASVPSTERRQGRPVVLASGRIAYQKAPWRFAEAARRFGDLADFVWIGDGTDELRQEWFGDSPVQVVGWLSREEAMTRMAAADVVLHPSLWEGLPYTLLEARALGVPCVASRVVGNVDAVVDGVTGLLFDDDAHMLDQLGLLLDPDGLARIRTRHHAWLETYEPSDLTADLARVYRRALSR